MLLDYMRELNELTCEGSELQRIAKERNIADYEYFVKDQLQKCVKAALIEKALKEGMAYNKAENAALACSEYKAFLLDLAKKKFELQESTRKYHALLNRRDALLALISSEQTLTKLR